jgi:hypothetical protein
MCICVYVHMYVYVSMFLCICVSVYVYLYLYMHMYKWNTTFKHNTHTQLLLMVTSYDEDRVWGWHVQSVWNSGVSISYGLQTQNSLPVLLWIWTFARKLPEMHPYGRDPAVFIHVCRNSFFKIIRISSYNSNPSRTRRFQLSCFVWTFCVLLLQPKVVQRTNPR